MSIEASSSQPNSLTPLAPANQHSAVLAIAASAALCSISLRTQQHSLYWESTDTNQHSEQILPAIANLLSQAQLGKPDVIVVDVGPGAFTSVRVACGVAQGLGLGWGCPVVAVNSLAALAQQALALHPQACAFISVLDARMSECYVACFSARQNAQQTSDPTLNSTLNSTVISTANQTVIACTTMPQLMSYAQVDTLNTLSADVVIGNAAAVIKNWPDLAPIVIDALPSARGVLAQFDADILHQHVNYLQPEQLAPLYVRDQVAYTAAQRLAGLDKPT